MHDSERMNEIPDLIGSQEAADILGVEVSTISRWSDDRLQTEDRRLTPVMRLNGKTGAKLFLRADVERLRDKKAEASA